MTGIRRSQREASCQQPGAGFSCACSPALGTYVVSATGKQVCRAARAQTAKTRKARKARRRSNSRFRGFCVSYGEPGAGFSCACSPALGTNVVSATGERVCRAARAQTAKTRKARKARKARRRSNSRFRGFCVSYGEPGAGFSCACSPALGTYVVSATGKQVCRAARAQTAKTRKARKARKARRRSNSRFRGFCVSYGEPGAGFSCACSPALGTNVVSATGERVCRAARAQTAKTRKARKARKARRRSNSRFRGFCVSYGEPGAGFSCACSPALGTYVVSATGKQVCRAARAQTAKTRKARKARKARRRSNSRFRGFCVSYGEPGAGFSCACSPALGTNVVSATGERVCRAARAQTAKTRKARKARKARRRSNSRFRGFCVSYGEPGAGFSCACSPALGTNVVSATGERVCRAARAQTAKTRKARKARKARRRSNSRFRGFCVSYGEPGAGFSCACSPALGTYVVSATGKQVCRAARAQTAKTRKARKARKARRRSNSRFRGFCVSYGEPGAGFSCACSPALGTYVVSATGKQVCRAARAQTAKTRKARKARKARRRSNSRFRGFCVSYGEPGAGFSCACSPALGTNVVSATGERVCRAARAQTAKTRKARKARKARRSSSSRFGGFCVSYGEPGAGFSCACSPALGTYVVSATDKQVCRVDRGQTAKTRKARKARKARRRSNSRFRGFCVSYGEPGAGFSCACSPALGTYVVSATGKQVCRAARAQTAKTRKARKARKARRRSNSRFRGFCVSYGEPGAGFSCAC